MNAPSPPSSSATARISPLDGRTATIAAWPGAAATAFSAAACSDRSRVVRIVRLFFTPNTFTSCSGLSPSRSSTAHPVWSASSSRFAMISAR
ncbi:hypothetical protein [Actinomadura madurae]|uniref:hypothetical protein n=1 Tax=Actinomadura madurae TaxID=1993 RepID=UPI0020D2415A|nr:hypothetical protein [Actinomadura madurae]MCQ0004374.1 hypothetical protein [Actinomadura madurae]